jgi:hypothetical protein
MPLSMASSEAIRAAVAISHQGRHFPQPRGALPEFTAKPVQTMIDPRYPLMADHPVRPGLCIRPTRLTVSRLRAKTQSSC